MPRFRRQSRRSATSSERSSGSSWKDEEAQVHHVVGSAPAPDDHRKRREGRPTWCGCTSSSSTYPSLKGRRERKSITVLVFLGLIVFTTTMFLGTNYTHCHQTASSACLTGSQLLHKVNQMSQNRVLVSIGTVRSRRSKLVKTLASLMRQTVPPGKIVVHYDSKNWTNTAMVGTKAGSRKATATSSGEFPVKQVAIELRDALGLLHLNEGLKDKDRSLTFTFPASALRGKMGSSRLQFREADPSWRSAKKLLGALYLIWNGTSPSLADNDDGADDEPLIVTADDDFVYVPTWLESLLIGHVSHPHAAVGLSGWRIKEDLHWGAPPVGEYPHPDGVWGSFPSVEKYVVKGPNIREPYRVGVLNGGAGVVHRPSYFDGGVFRAPGSTHLYMDDIWISGNLANNSVARFVVPLKGRGSDGRNVGEHLGSGSTVIDSKMGMSRARANDVVIEFFAKAWAKDGEEGQAGLWYSSKDVGPRLRGLLPLRHWISEHVILWLHSIGWVRRLVGDWRLKDE